MRRLLFAPPQNALCEEFFFCQYAVVSADHEWQRNSKERWACDDVLPRHRLRG